jgi:hypothetical protein
MMTRGSEGDEQGALSAAGHGVAPVRHRPVCILGFLAELEYTFMTGLGRLIRAPMHTLHSWS